MTRLTLDDLTRMTTVRARRTILDSPLSAVQHPARRGDLGHVVDVDLVNDVVFVEFQGSGSAIACVPDELCVA